MWDPAQHDAPHQARECGYRPLHRGSSGRENDKVGGSPQQRGSASRLRRLLPYSQSINVNEVRLPGLPLREPGLNLQGQDGVAHHGREHKANECPESRRFTAANTFIGVLRIGAGGYRRAVASLHPGDRLTLLAQKTLLTPDRPPHLVARQPTSQCGTVS